MPVPYYPQSTITPNLGLSLIGMDEVIADDFIIIDAFAGSAGGSIKVNGSVVTNPNFVDSATAVFTVVGNNIHITASGGGTPGSPVGSVQGNNAGAFAGLPGSSIDFTNGLLTLAPTGTGVALTITSDNNGSDIQRWYVAGNATPSMVVDANGSTIIRPISDTGLKVFGDSLGDGIVGFFVFGEVSPSFSLSPSGVTTLTPSNDIALVIKPDAGGDEAIRVLNHAGNITTFSVLSEGSLVINAKIFDGAASAGTSGQVLSSIGTGVRWINAGTVPVNTPAIAHEFFTAYNSVTGLFTASQPAFTDISGVLTAAQEPSTTVNAVTNDTNVTGSISAQTLTLGWTGQLSIARGGTGLNSTSQNFAFIGPTSGAGAPTWRALVAGDLPAGTGTVTSVALTMPAIFSVGGSPITSSGTLAVTLATETANSVWAGPTSGGAATPTFRALVAADLPAGTGTVTSFSAGALSPLFTTSVATATTTPALTFSLSTQTANFVFAGPTSGAAAGPTFRALVTADIPTGTVLWNQIGNANGNLTLANGTNTTEFDQTSNIAWLWYNTTTGTALTTNASPTHKFAANYFNVTSLQDTWTLGSSLAAGTNAISTFTIGHTGSTGITQLIIPSSISATTNPNIIGSAGGITSGITIGSNANLPLLVVSPAGQVDATRFYSAGVVQAIIRTTNTNTTNGAAQFLSSITAGFADFGFAVAPSATHSATPAMNFGFGGDWATTGAGPYIAANFGQKAIEFGAVPCPWITWAPTAGAGNFVGLQVFPTVNQTGTASGSYTALKIAVAETALLGTSNKLIDCFAGTTGTTEVFAVDNVGKVTQYGSVATVSQGMPAEYATVDLTGQGAAIAATTLYAVPANGAGMYRVSWCASVTTVDGVASVLGGTTGFQVMYTDIAVVKTSPRTVTSGVGTDSTNTTATAISGTIVVFADASTNIQYSMGYTSTTPGQMKYSLHIKLERL